MGDKSQKQVYLTRARYEEIRKELERLETVEREKLVEELKSSPPSGMGRTVMDPIREKQAFLEGNIIRLHAILASALIIEDQLPEGPILAVLIGTTVTVFDVQESESLCYSIVGPDEIDISTGKISHLSPVGQALLGHRVGDVVRVCAPGGVLAYRIDSIEKLRQ
jgi:transcription elongation factor GreA